MSVCRMHNRKATPRPSLLITTLLFHDLSQAPLGHGLDSVYAFEEQNLLLNRGREQGQVHKLGDPGAGQVDIPSGVGAVLVVAAVDSLLEPVREGEHAGRRGRACGRVPEAWGASPSSKFWPLLPDGVVVGVEEVITSLLL